VKWVLFPVEQFPKFVEAMIERNGVGAALKVYGDVSVAEFERAEEKYRKHF
jgi:hypothetical protein